MSKEVYSCKFCDEIEITDGATPFSGCSKNPNASSHYWFRLGNVGEEEYKCEKCGIVVRTDSTPGGMGCSKHATHYFKRVWD